tara:strand:+ start:162 stop:716 length:555 start_codon:yes stop_codon:yes gene_type:complete
MVSSADVMLKFIKNDNTNKIKYVILFFIFMIALSQNLFKNLFGCNLQKIIKNNYTKHAVSLLFLFLLVDINIDSKIEYKSNPLISLVYSAIIYVLVFLLLHSNRIYITFISIIIFVLIILDKFKSYYQSTINDQEDLQNRLDLIHKTANVFVIIVVLTIVIGTLTSLNIHNLKKTLYGRIKSCA